MDGETVTRLSGKRTAVIMVPLLLLGLANAVLVLQWGFNPIWGLLLVPPVLFVSAIGWIAIRGGLTDTGANTDRDQ